MTQPEEAVSGEAVETPQSPEDRLNAAFADPENIKTEDELPAEDEGGLDPEAVEEAEDDPEAEAEADDLPPIDAPVSWDAEAKETFKSLPREAQEIVAKREAERERFVQQKSQEAARARSEVEREALTQLSAYEQQVAQQLSQYAQALQPQRPDAALLATDPMQYALQQRAYDDAIAQQGYLQQQASEYARQAQMREQAAEQAYHAEQRQIIVDALPEYLDPTTGPELQRKLTAVAKELGYPDELIGQARATDILAMNRVRERFEKADKWDAFQKSKMTKVRQAKDLPRVAKPGSSQAPGAHRQQQYASDRQAMRSGDKDAERRVLDSFFQPKK